MPAAVLEAAQSISNLPEALPFSNVPLFQRFCVYLI
jgi:hypothetical protein